MITGLWCTGLDNSWDYRCRERGKKIGKAENGKSKKILQETRRLENGINGQRSRKVVERNDGLETEKYKQESVAHNPRISHFYQFPYSYSFFRWIHNQLERTSIKVSCGIWCHTRDVPSAPLAATLFIPSHIP